MTSKNITEPLLNKEDDATDIIEDSVRSNILKPEIDDEEDAAIAQEESPAAIPDSDASVSPEMSKKIKALLAECLGTAFLVYIGCGSVIANVESKSADIVSIALAFGFAVTALAYSCGHHSGGHFNPIVSIAMVIWGELDITTCILYITSQCLGAVLGAAFLMAGTGAVYSNPLELAVNAVNDESTDAAAFIMELVLSFLLVYVVGETAVNKNSVAKNNAPIAIGLAVFLANIVAIPFTGCSINPARSFGPAVISGEFDDLWIFILAPVCGGVIAALSSLFLFDIKN